MVSSSRIYGEGGVTGLSIDPGVKGCGVACWIDGRLLAAEYAKDVGMFAPFDVLVIELPVVYTQSKWKGDPNDLIELAYVVGRLAERAERWGAEIVRYKPREWAGQVPKEIRWERAEKLLSEDERAKIDWPTAKGLRHNVFDAIGIGLFYLERRR